MNVLPNTEGLINCDWLSFSVRLLETAEERDSRDWIFRTPPPSLRLVEFTGTNIYRRRLIVYHTDGRKVLTLLCSPHSRAIPANSCLVEVANEWLYHSYHWVMDLVYDLHPCTFSCLTRLDVCCDFQCQQRHVDLIKALAANDAYVAGKRDGAGFFSYTMEGSGIDRVPRQLSWGSKKSNIKWKLYNKSLEIFEIDGQGHRTCNKPYIADAWHAVGFDELNVWRLEVSICPMYKFEFHGRRIAWSDTWNGFVLEDLFISLYMTRFVVRLNQGHKDKSNDKRVYIVGDYG